MRECNTHFDACDCREAKYTMQMAILRNEISQLRFCLDGSHVENINLLRENTRLRKALEKIADPRKRDHSEPDAYTQLGCVMNIAEETLK